MQQQRVAENLYPLGNPSCAAHHMGTVNDERRRNISLQVFHDFDYFRFCGMVLRQISGIQHHKPHAAGEMSGVHHRNILKRFRRFHGILIPPADIPGHGNMYHILGFGKFFRKESFIVFHIRRFRYAILPLLYMGQQFIRLQLNFIQKTPLIRADIVRAYGNAELFRE